MRHLVRTAVSATLAAGLVIAASATASAAPSLEDAVAREMVEHKGGEAAAAYGLNAQSTPDPQIEPRDESGAWSFGGAVFLIPDDVEASPVTSLYLAERVGGQWQVHLDGTEEFAEAADRAPSRLFSSPGEQESLAERPGEAQAAAQPGLAAPWQADQGGWRHWGVHGNSGTSRPYNSIDFYGGDGWTRASAGGYIYYYCGTSTPHMEIRHGAGWTTGYYHLRQQTRYDSGSYVDRYAPLGHIGEQLPCGGRANGDHVHWTLWYNGDAVSVNGRTVGGWAWYEQNAYQGWAERNGTRLYNSNCCLTNYGPGYSEVLGTAHNPGGVVNVRNGPGASSGIVRTVSHGQQVPLACHVRGEAMEGPWGNTSDIWNRLEDGSYVSDAWMDTGSNDPVVPAC
ncbi:peptidoglycan DD-metalloendopeptidase family protein [Salininema proteolyticum]|uniref:Peptidoglycan DD-metalloendopeptidase family protein n=1 Tax=Salininema proteolyticum TaxID=1607685 RepID=A0ABV8TVB4_9ACTN